MLASPESKENEMADDSGTADMAATNQQRCSSILSNNAHYHKFRSLGYGYGQEMLWPEFMFAFCSRISFVISPQMLDSGEQ